MATDSTFFADATLGTQSGANIGLLQSAITVYGEKDRLLRFADICAGADTMPCSASVPKDLSFYQISRFVNSNNMRPILVKYIAWAPTMQAFRLLSKVSQAVRMIK